MGSLWKVLLLLLLAFSPCVIGCSSQLSEEQAESRDSQDDGEDQDADVGEEQ